MDHRLQIAAGSRLTNPGEHVGERAAIIGRRMVSGIEVAPRHRSAGLPVEGFDLSPRREAEHTGEVVEIGDGAFRRDDGGTAERHHGQAQRGDEIAQRILAHRRVVVELGCTRFIPHPCGGERGCQDLATEPVARLEDCHAERLGGLSLEMPRREQATRPTPHDGDPRNRGRTRGMCSRHHED